MTAIVAERGYAATSIAEVIKRARASRSTFYEQFGDKETATWPPTSSLATTWPRRSAGP